MSKNNVRIAIRDSTDSHNVAFFDNQAGIKYKSANLQRFLAGSASILTIKYNSKDIDTIRSGCKLAFRYKNRDYWLNVMSFEKKGFEVELTAYSLGLELNNETRGEHKPANAMSIAEYVAYYDPEHALTIGVNEVSDKRIKLEWTGTGTILARLFSVANSFGAELDFSVELNDDYSLKRQVLNIYKKGNLGTNKVSQPVRVGKELKVINYSDNIKELRTAVRATGKDGLTIDGLDKKIYDNNKELLYYSSGMTVYAPQSRDRFPSVGKVSNDNWIVEDLGETQYETKEALWGYMYGEIQKKSLPEITYEVEGAIEAGIGDTQTLIDDIHFEPALYVQARVSELEDDILTGKVTKSTFINFERKYSQIADILLKQVEALAEDAAPYIIRLSTNNGYIFKNGEGSSTITARLEKYSKDIAATWEWVVDNKVVGTGDKLTVKAEEIKNTMAVTVIAYVNGNEVVRDYMTFSNSDDGVGVESIDRYFTSSDQSDGVTIEGAEWSDKPPAPTEDGKYLWAYDEITYTDGTVTTTKPAAVGANFDVDAFRAEIAEDLKDVPNREEFENKIAEELANSKAEIETQIDTAKTQAESNAKEYADTINQETAKVAEQANAAADEIKADLVNVKNNLTDTSLVANNAQASVDKAKQDLTKVTSDLNTAKQDLTNSVAAVNTKVDSTKAELTQAKQDLTKVTSDLNTAKQDLTNSVAAVNTKVDSTKAELTQAKQDLTKVTSDLNTAKQDLTNSVAAVNTKVDSTKAELTQAKQDLTKVTSDLNTAKQDLTNSVAAVNTKVDSTKAELTQAKQDLTKVTSDLNTAKQDLTNSVAAVNTKVDSTKAELTQAKQDLTSHAQQLQTQANAQMELTNRVTTVEATANGTKTTVNELTKTVAQNGKDITSVTARTKKVEDNLLNTKTTLSQVKTTADSTSQKTATLETGLNGLNARFDSLSVGGGNLIKQLTAQKGLRLSMGAKPYQDQAHSLSDWIKIEPNTTYTLTTYEDVDEDSMYYSLAWYSTNNADYSGWISRPTEALNAAVLKGGKQYTSPANAAYAKVSYPTKYSKVKLERGNVATDYSQNGVDLEQKMAEYKQNADQNYASLQTTVQKLDGTVQHNKTVAEQTAEGFKTRIESLETYKDGETTRANQYFESAKTETARQLTVERTAIAKDYVAKSTYTSDVAGIRNELSATTTTANTIKTNLANYQATNNRAVANLQSNMQTANGDISSLKTKVEAVPGQITSAVSAVESKIPTSVGSTNLLLYSADPSKAPAGYYDFTSAQKTSEIYNGSVVYKTQSTWSGIRVNLGNLVDRGLLKVGDVLTYSVAMRAEQKTPIQARLFIRYTNQSNADSPTNKLESVNLTTDWQYISVTFTVTAKMLAANTKVTYLGWELTSNAETGKYVYYACNKIERGNVATGYSPAPEDAIKEISSLSSEIKQTADGITLLATKTELNSAKTELQSGIKTATDKANSNAQTISTHTTQISALNTGLNAKVSQSDFNTLSGRVTTAENNIIAKADELSSKISSVEGKIPTSVGSTNLLLYSADPSKAPAGYYDFTSAQKTSEIYNGSVVYKTQSTWSGIRVNLGNLVDRGLLKVGDVLTYSVAMRAEQKTPIQARLFIRYTNQSNADSPTNKLESVNLTTDWQYISVTFTVTAKMLAANTKVTYLGWELTSNAETGKYVYYACNKIERGNVATGYSPAPEDAIKEISSLSSEIKQTADGITLLATKTELNSAKTELQSGIKTATDKANSNAQTISTHTTQISALNTGLNAKVSQSDFNTLSGRVTTAENNIIAKADELSSKISSVEGKIPTSVGSTNLLLYSADPSKAPAGYYDFTSAQKTSEIYNGSVVYKTQSTWSGIRVNLGNLVDRGLLKVGDVLTYSVAMRAEQKTPIQARLFIRYTNQSDADNPTNKREPVNLTTDWQYISVTFTVTAKMLAANTKVTYLGWELTSNAETGKYVYYACNKIERGNVATGYSPAPEDTIKEFSSLSSEIKQTADGMTLLATKTELNTAKNELQSGINTATNKANSAQNTANSAQNTANSAQNTANSNAQTISTHTTQISALNTGLNAKVSQTDFNALSGRVTTAENNITAKADELSSKISSVEGKLPTSIDTVNLVKGTGSSFVMGYGITNTTWNETKKQTILDFSAPGVRRDIGDEILPQRELFFNFKPIKGVTYTQSIMIDTDATFNPNGQAHCSWFTTKGHNQQKAYIKKVGNYSYQIWSTYTWNLDDVALRAFDWCKLHNILLFRTTGTYLAFYKPKLTSGNLPSDWSPSPEDYDNTITRVSTEIKQTADGLKQLSTQVTSQGSTITSHTNSINSLTTGLSAKVSQTDFNKLSGRVTTAENNITAKADELSSKITSVEGKIPTELGVKNLIKQSTAKAGTRLPQNAGEHPDQAHSLSDWIKIEPNTTYTLTTYEDVDEDSMYYSLAWYSTNNADYSGWISRPTEALNAAVLKGGKQYTSPANAAYAKVSYPTKYSKVKLERGKVSTDYTPAPEDTVDQISSLSSEIKQTADGMTLLATKTELNTAKSDLQSGISTATSKADNAQATANSNAQTISNHTTQISALNTGLNAKVSQTDFNALSGRVTTAENNITAKADELSSKITSVEGKIPTELGVKNLIKQSTAKAGTRLPQNAGEHPDQAHSLSDWIKIEPNTTYTLTTYEDVDEDSMYYSLAWYSTNNADYSGWISRPTEALNAAVLKGGKQYTSPANAAYAKVSYPTKYSKVKLERGKVSTDYTPAPEDTVDQISSLSSEIKQTADGMTLLATKTELNTAKSDLQSGISTATSKADNAQATANSNAQTISNHTTQISALNTGLNAKVSQTDFNALSGRVTTAENNITAKADELSSKISSVEGKIPTSVGSTNLLLYSADPSKAPAGYYDFTSAQKTSEIYNGSVVYKTQSTWSGIRVNLGNLVDRDLLKAGDVLTYSVAMRAEQKTPMQARLFIRYTNQSDADSPTNKLESVNLTTDWQYISVTFTVTAKMLATNTKVTYLGWELTSNAETGKYVYYACNKIERGNVATGYSPAPEDAIKEISSLSSEIKQTADGMTLLATKTELNTAKNELQSGINTATNKANSAQNTANSAQNTANSAQNTANSNAQTISTHTTQISALNTGLNAKVSQSDFNTLSGRVTTAENNIIAKADELSSKISSVEGKIPTEIGGVNLLRNSKGPFKPNKGVVDNYVYYDSSTVYLEKNQSYVISGLTDGEFSAYHESNQESNRVVLWLTDRSKDINKIVSDSNTGAKGTRFTWANDTGTYCLRVNTYKKVADKSAWNIQVEKGNVKSDYAQSPLDTATQISSLSSEFKQTTDAIKASVTSLDNSTVKSSSLTINTDGVVIKAGKSTTDVANAIGSYFSVNQNAINLFSDKINVKGNMIVSGAITSDKIASKQINTAHLNGKIITADVISSNAVTADAIKAGAVTTDKMSANSINGDRITAGTLDAAKIKAGSITASQIASGTITSNQIKAGTISAANIAAGAITSDKIASNSIDASKIAAGAITANMIRGGQLNSTNGATMFDLNAGTLTFNNNYGYIQRVAGDKIFEITTSLSNTSDPSREYLTSAFQIRKSDNSRYAGLKFSLYNNLGDKPIAKAKMNADEFILYDSKNTQIFSVCGKSSWLGTFNTQGWRDIPVVSLHNGGLLVKDIGIGGHMKSLLKIVEELCNKTGVMWI